MALQLLSVEQATNGRLLKDDPETQRQLDAAMAAARRYCGWHVTPQRPEELTLDGPGGQLLTLPSLHVVALSAVVEDGAALDVSSLEWSQRGMIRKRNRGCWSDRFGAIRVNINHGFDDAPDFEAALLEAIERGAFATDSVEVRQVGPFQYGSPWGNAKAADSLFSESERALLNLYRLEPSP